MVIDFEGKELKVTAGSVHNMLGIPTGGTIFTNWINDLKMIQFMMNGSNSLKKEQ